MPHGIVQGRPPDRIVSLTVAALWGEMKAIADYDALHMLTGNKLFVHIGGEERQHKAELERLLKQWHIRFA